MNRPKLARSLRITWTAFWGLVALLLCVLWVQSYWLPVGVPFGRSATTAGGIVSSKGEFRLSYVSDIAAYNRVHKSPAFHLHPPDAILGFRYFAFSSGGWDFSAPHYFCALLSVAFAAAPWFSWNSRFSLRTLLIATTLVAVGLGLIVWLAR